MIASLEFTLTPPSHCRHFTTRRVHILPVPPTELTTPLPSHSFILPPLRKRFSLLVFVISLLQITITTTVYFYTTLRTPLPTPYTPLLLHTVSFSYYQHAVPLPPAFPYTETGSLLTFYSVLPRTLRTLFQHTFTFTLPLTLEHAPCVEHLIRYTRITPYPKGCSNHMGCLSAPPLVLLPFEYHNYYPP